MLQLSKLPPCTQRSIIDSNPESFWITADLGGTAAYQFQAWNYETYEAAKRSYDTESIQERSDVTLWAGDYLVAVLKRAKN